MSACRQAIPADADEVFSLACEFATSFTPAREEFDASFLRLLASGDAALLVAKDADHVVAGYLLGFVRDTFYANGPVAWVEEIVVQEGQRRNGLGSELMAVFEAHARSRGARLVALATRRASAFYEAIGYGESATYFRKDLGA